LSGKVLRFILMTWHGRKTGMFIEYRRLLLISRSILAPLCFSNQLHNSGEDRETYDLQLYRMAVALGPRDQTPPYIARVQIQRFTDTVKREKPIVVFSQYPFLCFLELFPILFVAGSEVLLKAINGIL
jgi:hypothetical protein